MVIQKFNKLIRNKWLWGVFAIIVGGAFAFDFAIDSLLKNDSQEPVHDSGAGKLAGEAIDLAEFQEIAEDIRGFGRMRSNQDSSEVNLEAWRNYAAIQIADKNGIAATDDEVKSMIRNDRSFQQNGAFSFQLYNALLRENGLTPEIFEASLRRRLTLTRIGKTLLESAAWTSPMELDQAIADMTDTFTVKVATFTEDKDAKAKVTVDDAAIKKWYDENVKSLELPARMKIRYVKFNATDPLILAKMPVTEDEMRDQYDATIDKYTSTDTNGVETVKKFEEVKSGIEKELKQIAAVYYFETNLNFRAYAVKAAKGGSRLDEIAREDGLKVETSDWFSADGGYQDGFMVRASRVCPGAKGFAEAVAELDPENDDLKYAIYSSDSAVWLAELKETSPKHTPTFEEAKEPIRPRVLKAAQADAFKASVEAIIKKGAKEVLAAKDVTTNLTFSVADLQPNQLKDQVHVARAASKLAKGGISDFTLVSPGKALVVVCEDRVAGDAAKAMVLRSQVQNDVAMLAANQLPDAWRKWNLENLGFEPGELTSTEKIEIEE